MRKYLYSSHSYGQDFPPPPLLLPSSSPCSSPSLPLQFTDFTSREFFFFSSVPVAKSFFDFATLSCVAGLLLLSFVSFSFVLHLRFRSRRLHHLQNFNSLWTVKLLLVSLAALWAVNEILRLPFVRRNYLYPFLPSISLQQEAAICKLHVVLSLGFFEPGFFITLLFLLSVSIKKRSPCPIRVLVSVFVACFPIILLQTFFVYFPPLEAKLWKFLHGSSVLSTDQFGDRTVLCTYPFFSCVVFAVFAISYVMVFLFSSWRVLEFVINKSIRRRINTLSAMIMIALPVQILCLSLSWLWLPEDVAYGSVVLSMFLCVACSIAVGEVILVIKPITDSLAAGGNSCQWNSCSYSQRSVVDRCRNQE